MISDLLWRLRIKNRFALAWWAFCNPDNLTMLRHELQTAADLVPEARRYSHGSRVYHGTMCSHWLNRFLNIPVR